MEEVAKKPRGFATWDKDRLRAICRAGGKNAQQSGLAHRWTREEAAAAGKKGGSVMAARPGYMAELGRKGGQSVSAISGHMAALGRKGGVAAQAKRAKRETAIEDSEALLSVDNR